MFDICYYHCPCSDGIIAAWSSYLYCDNIELKGIRPTYKKYNKDNLKNKKIVFVDICPLISEFDKILLEVDKIVLLDHHKTNYETYQSKKFLDKYNSEIKSGKLEIIIDMKRSGCQIAWDYFTYITDENKYRWINLTNTIHDGTKRPWFINYVADADLWTWKLDNSKEINIALNKLKHLDSIDNICKLFKQSYVNYNGNLKENIDTILQEFYIKGSKLIEEDNKLIEEHLNNKTELRLYLNKEINSYQLVSFTICEYHEIRSELGNKSLDIRYNLYDKYKKDDINNIIKFANKNNTKISQKLQKLIKFYNTDFSSENNINVSVLSNIHDSAKISDRILNTGLTPDFAVIVNEIKDDNFVGLSLRSNVENGLQDVSVIAKQLNGGGHANASGGRLVYDKKLNKSVVSILNDTFIKIN